ncbi:hypothetical protein ACVGW3_05015, partial [Enterobacter hormaechei]
MEFNQPHPRFQPEIMFTIAAVAAGMPNTGISFWPCRDYDYAAYNGLLGGREWASFAGQYPG